MHYLLELPQHSMIKYSYQPHFTGQKTEVQFLSNSPKFLSLARYSAKFEPRYDVTTTL